MGEYFLLMFVGNVKPAPEKLDFIYRSCQYTILNY